MSEIKKHTMVNDKLKQPVVSKQCQVMLRNCLVKKGQDVVLSPQYIKKSNTIATPNMKKISIQHELCTPRMEPALATELKRAIDEKNILTTKTKSKYMFALNELEEANIELNRISRKERAIQEIIDSEKMYLKQLDIINNFFKKPLYEQKILVDNDINKIFGTISIILGLNKELLSRLEKNKNNIGQAFSKMAPFFKLYSAYAYDYKTILDILQSNETENEEFSKLLKNQESRPEVQTKLLSLLIMPIQRIPRYCLLLKQVLAYTLPNEEDYELLKESLKQVEESAEHVNSLVAERENSEILVQIQHSLVNGNPAIIRPGRKLIKEGQVVKIEGSHSRTVYLVAMSDIIMLCKIKKENVKLKNALSCSCILPLSKCKVRQNPLSRNIEIRCDTGIVMLYVEKQTDFDEWVTVLKASVTRFLLNRQTLRKESSSRKPAFSNCDIEFYNEIGISPGVKQRKRKIQECDVMDQETVQSRYLPQKLRKRKCIRDAQNKISTQSEQNVDTNDSLYPLRKHYIHCEKQEVDDVQRQEQRNEEIFEFGNPDNAERGFNFCLRNFFTALGNTFKRFFIFRR